MRLRFRILIGLVLVLVAASTWWLLQRPSHDRTWQLGLVRLPWVEFADDLVVIHDFRNFDWHPDGTAEIRYETRCFDLATVDSLWFCLSVFNPEGWRGPAHSLLSFGFTDGRYLAVSVEARKEVGENYSVWKGLARRFELMYVIGDERDLVGNRVAFRPDDVWLYPLQATPEFARRLLAEILHAANGLHDKPQWYNTVADNCTSRLYEHSESVAPGKIPPSWKILLPGYADELLQSLNLIAGVEDLASARARYYIKDRATAALAAPDFSQRIRVR